MHRPGAAKKSRAILIAPCDWTLRHSGHKFL